MKLENLKINFLGDSITEGCGVSSPNETFHQIIKREYGLKEAYNCGISGTRIAKQSVPLNHQFGLYFALRAKAMPSDVDAIVVFGGTNDFGHGDAEFGTIEDTDANTFYGALNNLILSLKEDYPNSKIIFMTPLRRTAEDVKNSNGKILADYVDAIIEVSNKHNLPVIDLFRSDILDPNDATKVPDGLHPNKEGHIIMADYIAKKLLEI